MENGPFIDGLPSYKMVDLSMAMLNNQMVYIHIWVNYNNSLTWIKAIWGWFPLLTMIPVRSQWGRYNLPRYIYIYDYICIYNIHLAHLAPNLSLITPDLWWSSQLSDLWKLLVDGVSVGAGFSPTFGTKSPIFGWKWGVKKTQLVKNPLVNVYTTDGKITMFNG